MKSNIITLFSVQPPPRTAPSSFGVSILLHVVGSGLLLLGLSHAPRVDDQSVIKRYTIRLLNPPRIETQSRRAVRDSAAQSAARSNARDLSPGGASASQPSTTEQLAQLNPPSQTLVQPDAPPDLLLPPETPIPLVLLWSPDNSPSKTIVAPPPQETTVAEVRPSFVKPTHESELDDLNISATHFPAQTPVIPASTTSPLVVRGPEPIKMTPATASEQLEQPTPARLVSLSDVQTQGAVVIPLANQDSQAASPESLVLRKAEKSSGNGIGGPVSNQNGVGAGDGSGFQRGSAANGTGTAAQIVTNTGTITGVAQDLTAGSGLGYEPSVTHISLPKDGQFGVVVVGSSVAEQYPETIGIWNGRVVYTVFLHVGLGKNWILQYSLPRAEEVATAGNIVRPAAPWPYEMIRPHFNRGDFNSDAIMVHGFVNLAGRFERLAIVFPTEFAPAKFVLNALQQWQFRAARQNGLIAAVEILLIIPDETE